MVPTKTDAFAEGKSGIRTEEEGREGGDDEREGPIMWPTDGVASRFVDNRFFGISRLFEPKDRVPCGSLPTFGRILLNYRPPSPGIIRILSPFSFLFPLSRGVFINPFPLPRYR